MRVEGGYCGLSRLWADIEPAASRWLPWPGRTSRWWFEVRCDQHTHAYEAGGSGGGFTLRSCFWRAVDGLQAIEWAVEEAQP